MGVGMGWLLIGTGDPDVALSVPAVVAVVPGPVAVLGRWRRDDFAGRRWRPDADGDLGLRDAGAEEESAGAEEEILFHVVLLMLLEGWTHGWRFELCACFSKFPG
jgi:hypothetical protein